MTHKKLLKYISNDLEYLKKTNKKYYENIEHQLGNIHLQTHRERMIQAINQVKGSGAIKVNHPNYPIYVENKRFKI